MRFISYAQELEDLIAYVVLKDYVKQPGIYIDVGANDPVNLSVTKIFYDMGWSGINIEPLEDMCDLLARERPRDINLCIGAGAEEGMMELSIAGMRSSFSKEVQGTQGDIRSVTKQILPLQFIYDRFFLPGTDIHFCKIDVEGFEKEVLCGIDYSKLRPWLMIVESTIPGTKTPCYEKWENILLSNQYELAMSFGINRYYVAKERSFLKSQFGLISPFLKKNTICVCKLIQ